ncbi:hypothetical protein SCHPADRAFT_878002 [Schizopora paradoxa]|uniref:Cupredoxin n=1 Tax=Schizopora paradoxa TaxID=27342 RepID=A0A0H2RG77_9AGAM|nr:hypothetical protein SCHPADRAFT_878002 [Schizopora paradoxa]
MKFSFAAIPAFIAAASAVTHTVLVGENQGLTYNPSSVTAAEGDVIAFQFVAKNHSVTQSTFAAPCTKSGVDSGFFPVSANATVVPQWSFTLNNASAPLWFYCAQTGHCGQGMVFAVNPTAAKSFDAFQAAANATVSNSTTSSNGTSSSAPSPSASASGTPSGAMARFSLSSASAVTLMGLAVGLLL